MTTINPSATWTLSELADRHIRHALDHLAVALRAAQNHAPRLIQKDGDAYCPACDEYIFRSAQIGAVSLAQQMMDADVDERGSLGYDSDAGVFSGAHTTALTDDAPLMVHFPSGPRAPHLIRPAEGAGEVTAW